MDGVFGRRGTQRQDEGEVRGRGRTACCAFDCSRVIEACLL